MRATAADKTGTIERGAGLLVCLLAWLVPGAGHLFLHRTQKGLVFLLAVPAMFMVGLALDGRLFPFEFAQPLVGLAALANLGNGLPFFLARFFGSGAGNVIAASYEYGNTFLIVAGLLNTLCVLDAWDIAVGRK